MRSCRLLLMFIPALGGISCEGEADTLLFSVSEKERVARLGGSAVISRDCLCEEGG